MELIIQFSDPANYESCFMKDEVRQILSDILKEKIIKEISHDKHQETSHIK